jgi:hypothetical protein
MQMVCEKFAIPCGRYWCETALNTICYRRLAFWQYCSLSGIQDINNLTQPNIQIPDSVKRNSSWRRKCRWGGEEISQNLCNSIVHCRAHRSPLLSQKHPGRSWTSLRWSFWRTPSSSIQAEILKPWRTEVNVLRAEPSRLVVLETRSAEVQGVRSPGLLNFALWRLMFFVPSMTLPSYHPSVT